MTNLDNTDFAYEVNDALTVAIASLQLDLSDEAMDELLNDATLAVCEAVEFASRPTFVAPDTFCLMGDDCERDMLYTQVLILMELDWIELDAVASHGNDLVYFPTMNGLIVSDDGNLDELMNVAERDFPDVIATLNLI